jgi:hypothetical protein
VRFENKNIFFCICRNALAYYNAGVVVVGKFGSRRIGPWIKTYMQAFTGRQLEDKGGKEGLSRQEA